MPSSCPCKIKYHCPTPGVGRGSQAGWGLSGGVRLLPALPLWTPRVTAGHGRSNILRGVPGKAASGKESATSPAPAKATPGLGRR